MDLSSVLPSRFLKEYVPSLETKALKTWLSTENLVQELLHVFQTSPIHGSTHLDILEVGLEGNQKVHMLVIGEIHENPGTCPSGGKDVVQDIVLKLLTEYEPVLLIFETFFHSSTHNANDMMAKLQEMKTHHYPLDLLSECLSTRNQDSTCVYRGKSNALRFLRAYAAAMRTCSLSLAQHGITDTNLQNVSRRMFPMDARENLGMCNAFELPETLKDADRARVRQSLANITQHTLESLYLADLQTPAWKEAFRTQVLHPFLKRCQDIYEHPTTPAYIDVFLEITEVVGVSQMLGEVEACVRHNMHLPFIVYYAGDEHRKILYNTLRKLSVFSSVQKVAEAWDPSHQGSCAQRVKSHR